MVGTPATTTTATPTTSKCTCLLRGAELVKGAGAAAGLGWADSRGCLMIGPCVLTPVRASGICSYADYAPECTGLGWDGSYFSKGTKVSTTTASSFNDCALQTFDSDGASFNFDSDKGTCTILMESYTKLQKYLKPKSTMMAGYPDPDTCS